MTAPLRVAVIGGGTSGEHEVSLASAAAVSRALDPNRYQPVCFTIDRAGGWLVEGRPQPLARVVDLLQACAVALPVVHGAPGEDGALAALLGFAGIPHTGPSLRAGALAMDKVATKQLAVQLGIAVAPACVVTSADRGALAWHGPVVVKPAGAGSSLGVTYVAEKSQLVPALDEALRHDTRVLVEEVVHGREVDLGLLRLPDGSLKCGPPLQIAHEGVFGYDDKYCSPPHFLVPAPLSAAECQALEAAAVAIAEALESTGVIRVDFFLTDHGPVLNEVNTLPGMTDRSQVPLIFAAAGLPYPALLEEMLTAALRR